MWCARNLGFLATLGFVGVTAVCGPLLLFLVVSGPLYAITSIGYMPWFQAASWITASLISISLCFYGMFLLIQYFRYPKIGFGLSKRVFWITSLTFCPAWIIPVTLTLNWPLRLPPEDEWSGWLPWVGLGGALMIFPFTHFVFSAIALFTINNKAEPADPPNPCPVGTFGISPACAGSDAKSKQG